MNTLMKINFTPYKFFFREPSLHQVFNAFRKDKGVRV